MGNEKVLEHVYQVEFFWGEFFEALQEAVALFLFGLHLRFELSHTEPKIQVILKIHSAVKVHSHKHTKRTKRTQVSVLTPTSIRTTLTYTCTGHDSLGDKKQDFLFIVASSKQRILTERKDQ